jgi:hypothetical protein
MTDSRRGALARSMLSRSAGGQDGAVLGGVLVSYDAGMERATWTAAGVARVQNGTQRLRLVKTPETRWEDESEQNEALAAEEKERGGAS